MQGKRSDRQPHQFEPGEYGLHEGIWYAMCPNGMLANLTRHAVTEHADRSISVTPSILVSNRVDPDWHGYLTGGVFLPC